jgi:pilus assembly protein Flp/PilA
MLNEGGRRNCAVRLGALPIQHSEFGISLHPAKHFSQSSGPLVNPLPVRADQAVKDTQAAAIAPAGRSGHFANARQSQRRSVMNLKSLLSKLVRDEQGGEVLEYALIAGLIVIAAIAAITTVGTKVLGRWTSLQNSM